MSNETGGQESAKTTRNLSPDLSHHIKGCYRLIKLVIDDGLGDPVPKTIIDQESFKRYIDLVSPGSYRSSARIDFDALDKHAIKPRGVCGSISSLANFLLNIGSINSEIAALLCEPRDESSGRPALCPGIYLLDGRHIATDLNYIIFWPEDDTWDDDAGLAASDNRTIFMRYLGQLSDQLVCLISDEHAASLTLDGGKTHTHDANMQANSGKMFKTGNVEFPEVAADQSTEAGPIYETISIKHLTPTNEANLPSGYPSHLPSHYLNPRLIVGDAAQGILFTKYVAEGIERTEIEDKVTRTWLESLFSGNTGYQVDIDENIDERSVSILIQMDFVNTRCGDLESRWKTYKEKLKSDLQTSYASKLRDCMAKMHGLEEAMTVWMICKVSEYHPGWVLGDLLKRANNNKDTPVDLESARMRIEAHFNDYHDIILEALAELKAKINLLEQGQEGAYNNSNSPAKSQVYLVDEKTVDAISENSLHLSDSCFKTLAKRTMVPFKAFKALFCPVAGSARAEGAQETFKRPSSTSTGGLRKLLGRTEKRKQHDFDLRNDHLSLVDSLWIIILAQSKSTAQQLKDALLHRYEGRLKAIIAEEEKQNEAKSWHFLRDNLVKALRRDYDETKPTIRIKRIQRVPRDELVFDEERYLLNRIKLQPQPAGFQYKFYPIGLKCTDQRGASPHQDLSRPIINSRDAWNFTLPPTITLRYLHLIGKERCFMILSDSGKLKAAFDFTKNMGASVGRYISKKAFYVEEPGQQTSFAVDESSRSLILLSRSNASLQIHRFKYNVDKATLSPYETPANLTRWYPQGIPTFSKFLFISGSDEEFLLVDENGDCRFYSWITKTFGGRTTPLKPAPAHIFLTPDSSHLFWVDSLNNHTRMQCIDRNTFGQGQAVEISLPPGVSAFSLMGITSFSRSDTICLIILDLVQEHCLIMAINVPGTYKIPQDLQALGNAKAGKSIKTTNSLINCHADVWSRFPIHPSISREPHSSAVKCGPSILFVSRTPHLPFSSYFKSKVAELKSITDKSSASLQGIRIETSETFSPPNDDVGVSTYPMGYWLAGLLCLVPINIAVTTSNHFLPLRDGLFSIDLEEQLLGASILQIIQSISFGWYEPVFGSYMADKPVKIVSSISEGPTDGSYLLNHLVGSSFSQPATSQRPSVWMSATPEANCLIISLDFKRIQGRSAASQEDTFLVLLMTAISNHVLFVNDFASSRQVDSLFSSFRSCIETFEPESNLSLFQSHLNIVIQGVDNDNEHTVKADVSSALARGPERDGPNDFLKRLHGSDISITPWHAIGSPQCHDIFSELSTQVMQQPVKHERTATFSIILKTILAKLKTNDWSPLDRNLAAQRGLTLSSVLPLAFCFGPSHPTVEETLKDYHIEMNTLPDSSKDLFYLSGGIHPTGAEFSAKSCLRELHKGFRARAQRFSGEDIHFKAYQQYLDDLVASRIDGVSKQFRINVEDSSSNSEMAKLSRRFDELAERLRASMTLCGTKCSFCELLCLDTMDHDGTHDCGTSHKCSNVCGFIQQHEGNDRPTCDLPAGHVGSHSCKPFSHLCDQICTLESSNGCLKQCSSLVDHLGPHRCGANIHACGAPCDLADCPRACVIDSQERHQRHCCQIIQRCPHKCQLCGALCSTPDHFHQKDAIHLCGREHSCPQLCEMRGICEIDMAPRETEAQFLGKHSVFQYTKFTQVARRLPCAIRIPSNMLQHGGSHCHSIKGTKTHYCEEKCKQCGYYCTLPSVHDEARHKTKHGSMVNAEWVVEGDDEVSLDLQGRKYATGDSGGPMLCSMVCKAQGRHVHVATCRSEDRDYCSGPGIEHIKEKVLDWTSHEHFWASIGFEDPYNDKERLEFALCDQLCGGEEHSVGGTESYCTLPLFHAPACAEDTPPNGHISYDGHAFTCRNPALEQRPYHIFFTLDCSGSMSSDDRRPLEDTPVSQRMASTANNRFGSALSAMYGFWVAREAAAASARQDKYTVISFNHRAWVSCDGDMHSSPDDLLGIVAQDTQPRGGTEFNRVLELIQTRLEASWDPHHYPVVIFLSDGESDIEGDRVGNLCRSASTHGKPLAFYAVSFGEEEGSNLLRKMAEDARQVYATIAPSEAADQCRYHDAVDSIQITDTFIGIARSLRSKRAALAS
ncbi:hypothetical protein CPB86DRAFT_758529 [Serendipita vermifera]|nr:hypothetical protein CPB86DRAFT_758529 [Serendipita vermifera]